MEVVVLERLEPRALAFNNREFQLPFCSFSISVLENLFIVLAHLFPNAFDRIFPPPTGTQ